MDGVETGEVEGLRFVHSHISESRCGAPLAVVSLRLETLGWPMGLDSTELGIVLPVERLWFG
jgi:hypothetical protein